MTVGAGVARGLVFCLVLAVGGVCSAQSEEEPEAEAPIVYGKGEQLCELADPRIGESSGVACSRLNEGVFWTHNDSGGKAQIFAFDAQGVARATVALAGASAVDWEDMASFSLGKRKAFLLIADTGDNDKVRGVYTLYLVPEPKLGKKAHEGPLVARVAATIRYRYPEGAQDCEAVAVDPTAGVIYLATRENRETRSAVYSLPLPKKTPKEPLVAEPVGELKHRKVTAMDLSPDGLRAVVLTYPRAFVYRRGPDEDWKTAFGRAPQSVTIPRRKQGEAVCYGPEGRSLYLTSEKRPTPLFVVRASDR